MVTIMMLNIMVNIMIQNISANLFGDNASWLYNVGVPLLLILLFGDIIPKSIALCNNEAIALRIAPFLSRLRKILTPVRLVLVEVTAFVSRAVFFFLRPEKQISLEELRHALLASRQYGVIQDMESKLLLGFLKMEEMTLKELMYNRQEALYYDIEEPLAELINLFKEKKMTEVPVCKAHFEEILGVISLKDFLTHEERVYQGKDLMPLVQRSYFLPESLHANQALSQMNEAKQTTAIIVDEYGVVSGIVTLHDLIATIVEEAHLSREESLQYSMIGPDVMIASGQMELSELEQVFGVTLETPANMITVGGFLTEMMGDIPKSGAKWENADFFFHVLSSDPHRVRRVYIRRAKKGK